MDKIDSTTQKISDEELERAITEKAAEIKAKAKPLPNKETAAGHRMRVKERFKKSGLEGFAPHEILELLLFYSIPQKDTKPIAHTLINRFGGISGVFNADVSELTKISGITENTAILFKLIPQLINAYYADSSKSVSCTNTKILTSILKPYFVGAGTEKFFLACFDSDLKLLSVTQISRGIGTYTAVEMRRILSEVIKSECTMAALAHNHPHGSPKPSDEDAAVTRKINEVLSAVDVKLMDHIIIGNGKTYSMRDGGELSIFD